MLDACYWIDSTLTVASCSGDKKLPLEKVKNWRLTRAAHEMTGRAQCQVGRWESGVARGDVRDTIRALFFVVFTHNYLLNFR